MKFCTSCQGVKTEGERQRRGKVWRWICKDCLERKSESIYKSTGVKSSYRERAR